MKIPQKYLAELFGTLILVFMGTTAIVAVGKIPGTPLLVVVPFAFGLALLAGIYAFGAVSGGHFNPAVSLAMFLDRRISFTDLIGYWCSQFVGGILASAILLLATTKSSVATTVNVPSSNGTAVVIEIVLTAIFVAVILQATRSDQVGRSALIAIPFTLVVVHLAGIPFSGSSVNPARSLGPAVIGNSWHGIWIYFVGPAAGGVIAWMVHTIVVRGQAPTAAALTGKKKGKG